MKYPPQGIMTQKDRAKMLFESQQAVKECTANEIMSMLDRMYVGKEGYSREEIEAAVRAGLGLPKNI